MARINSPQEVQAYNEAYVKQELKSLPQIYYENIPDELKQDLFPFWILWEATPKLQDTEEAYSEDHPPKILKRPVSSGWQSLENQRKYSLIQPVQTKKIHTRPVGLGFTFNEEHPFICIDIDDASPANSKLLSVFKSYTEWSPSGKGAHIWIRTLTLEDKLKVQEVMGRGKRNKSAERDLFISSGYVTITGKPIAIYSEDTIAILSAKEIIDKLTPYFIHDITSLNTELAKEESKALKAIHDKKHKPKKHQKISTNQLLALLDTIPVQCLASDTFEKLTAGYGKLDLDCIEEAREPWLIIGQALHHHFGGTLQGCMIWDNWSKKGNKYNEEAIFTTWKSFQKEEGITIATIIKLANAQKLEFADVTSKGVPLGTPRNFKAYLTFLGFTAKFNMITNEINITPPARKMEEWGIGSLSVLSSIRQAADLIHGDIQTQGVPGAAFTTSKIKSYLRTYSQLPENSFHPIKDYFAEVKEKWDGKSRIADLLDTIKTPDNEYREAYKLFLRKWLIQCVAAAHASPERQYMLNLVMILIGPQGIGKTKWVQSLFPKALRAFCTADKDVKMSAFRSDNVKLTMELTSTLICNINEIDRSFMPSTFSDFKAFLDKTSEQIVLPYGDAPVMKSRQTVFIGSTNRTNFLQDTTGNRRFFLLRTSKLLDDHTIDVDQLWAEISNYYHAREVWWIDQNTTKPKEMEALAIQAMINNQSMYIRSEGIEEKLDDIFDTSKPFRVWNRLTFVQIRTYVGLNDLTANSRKFNEAKYTLETWLKSITPHGKYEITTGEGVRPRKYYTCPPLRDKFEVIIEEPEPEQVHPDLAKLNGLL